MIKLTYNTVKFAVTIAVIMYVISFLYGVLFDSPINDLGMQKVFFVAATITFFVWLITYDNEGGMRMNLKMSKKVKVVIVAVVVLFLSKRLRKRIYAIVEEVKRVVSAND